MSTKNIYSQNVYVMFFTITVSMKRGYKMLFMFIVTFLKLVFSMKRDYGSGDFYRNCF